MVCILWLERISITLILVITGSQEKFVHGQDSELKNLVSTGYSLSDLGRYQEAISYYDRVLGIDPNHSGALNNKGLALVGLGRYEEAIQSYDKALAGDPNCINAFINKGTALVNLFRREEAIQS